MAGGSAGFPDFSGRVSTLIYLLMWGESSRALARWLLGFSLFEGESSLDQSVDNPLSLPVLAPPPHVTWARHRPSSKPEFCSLGRVGSSPRRRGDGWGLQVLGEKKL